MKPTEPDRVPRYTAMDPDFTVLPEPITLEETVVEQPTPSSELPGSGWDAGGVDGDAG